jgi:hypothetical protein
MVDLLLHEAISLGVHLSGLVLKRLQRNNLSILLLGRLGNATLDRLLL